MEKDMTVYSLERSSDFRPDGNPLPRESGKQLPSRVLVSPFDLRTLSIMYYQIDTNAAPTGLNMLLIPVARHRKARIPDPLDGLMKLLLKLLIGGAVLLTVAFAQEPKHAVVPQEPVASSRAASTEPDDCYGRRRTPRAHGATQSLAAA